MKFRMLLAVALAAWIGQAEAQYGMPGEGMTTMYTGLWWNPNEPGWGLNTAQQGNVVFATLFTYDPDGQPLWLVASGLTGMASYSSYGMMTTTYTGPLYRTHGPAFDQVPWSAIGFDQVGTMSITWSSMSTATLSYTYDGATVTKLIQRQVFSSPVPQCMEMDGSRAGEANYQDLWWNPDESGWGMNLAHQGDVMFATLFTYGAGGRDKWFVASGLQRQADGSFTGALYETTGPAFNTMPWQAFAFDPVGNMTLRFSDGENGTLTYNVGPSNVVKAIRRQVFGATTSVCR